MSDLGKSERATQDRVIALFVHGLGYRYLGDWSERNGNSNINQLDPLIDESAPLRACEASRHFAPFAVLRRLAPIQTFVASWPQPAAMSMPLRCRTVLGSLNSSTRIL